MKKYNESEESIDELSFMPPTPERKPTLDEAINKKIEEKNNRFYSDMKGRFEEFSNREKTFSKQSKELAETLRQCDVSSLQPLEQALFLRSIASYEIIAKEADHFPEINEESLSTLDSMMGIFFKVDSKLSASKYNQAFKERACGCLWSLLHLDVLMPIYQKVLSSHDKKNEIFMFLPTPFQNTLRLQLFSSEFLKSIDKQFDVETKEYFTTQIQGLKNLDEKSQLIAKVANLIAEKLLIVKKEDSLNKCLSKDGKKMPPILHEDVLENMKDTLIRTVVTLVLEEKAGLDLFETMINNKIELAYKKSSYPRRTCDVFYTHLMQYYFPSIETDRKDELKELMDKIRLIKEDNGTEESKLNAMKTAIHDKYNGMATHWRFKTVRNSRLCWCLLSLTETIKDYSVGSGHSFYYLTVKPTPDNYHELFTEYSLHNNQGYTLLEYALHDNNLYEIDKELGQCNLLVSLTNQSCKDLFNDLNMNEKMLPQNKLSYRVIEKLSEEKIQRIVEIVKNSKKTTQLLIPAFFMSELNLKLASRNNTNAETECAKMENK